MSYLVQLSQRGCDAVDSIVTLCFELIAVRVTSQSDDDEEADPESASVAELGDYPTVDDFYIMGNSSKIIQFIPHLHLKCLL